MAMTVERPDQDTDNDTFPTLRAFLAILTPPASAIVEALRSDAELATLPVRWLLPDGLHLTLAFLGEVPRHSLQEAWPRLAAVAAQHRPIPLRLGDPIPFPDVQRPRLVAAEVQGDLAALAELQRQVALVLEEFDFALDDRPFRPHVSLGRLRPPLLRGQPAALAAALRARAWAPERAFQASAVSLMRSDLFPDGSRYSVLAEAPLKPRG